MSDAPSPPASEPPESSAAAPKAPSPPVSTREAPGAAPTPIEPKSGPDILPREPAGPPGKSYFWGTGRRKRAVARVRIRPGEGAFKINGRQLDEYFHLDKDRQAVAKPLEATGAQRKVDIFVRVHGGGTTGQAGAVVLGIARALKTCNPDYEPMLREGHFLTRDARKVERKKYGQRGARRRFQFSKR